MRLLIIILSTLQIVLVAPQTKLVSDSINTWAQVFGNSLNVVGRKLTTNNYYQGITISEVSVTDSYAEAQRDEVLKKLKKLVIQKQKLVKKITQKAEESFSNHVYNGSLSNGEFVKYHKAKNLIIVANISEIKEPDRCKKPSYIMLLQNAQFWDIKVNENLSTAHVPTNVFDCSKQVQNVADWTTDLDKIFEENRIADTAVKWQYFASQTGFFKIFPGIEWHIPLVKAASDSSHTPPVDFFDCRSQDWYVQAASYPKDVVILIDSSGSMKGRRTVIANNTVSQIFATLSENDFFNVIMFTNKIKYIGPSYNRTLVQATQINKDKAIQNLKLEPTGMANYEKGFNEAFDVLEEAKAARNASTLEDSDSDSADCNQVIMLITDGAPESYSALFKLRNPNKNVRIFTYLIGQEATDLESTMKIACDNKGYAVQISTLADVRENVQKYIPVVARSNAVADEHFFIWTGIHNNQMKANGSSEPAMMQMFTSVAQAVYDRQNKTITQHIGKLLGVSGVDVPIHQLQNTLPAYKLGVFAYFFAITNNGYMLFHPEFKPTYFNSANKLTLRPYYQNVDISRIEFPNTLVIINQTLSEGQLEEIQAVKDLRDKMVNGSIGTAGMSRTFLIDNNRRFYKQPMKYFFAPLKDANTVPKETITPKLHGAEINASIVKTPFTVGIAYPWDANNKRALLNQLRYPAPDAYTLPNLRSVNLCLDKTQTDCKDKKVTISTYKFCEFGNKDDMKLFNENPGKLLENVYLKTKTERIAMNCDEIYLKRLYNDAKGSKNFYTISNSVITTEGLDIGTEMVFFVSGTGLIRWHQKTNSSSDHTKFLESLREATKFWLYSRTVVLNSDPSSRDMLVVTGPSESEVNDPERARLIKAALDNNLTESAVPDLAVTVTKTIKTGNIPIAIEGFRSSYSAFSKHFLTGANVCNGQMCLNCSSPEVQCYLIDNDAYVVASKKIKDVGKPLDTFQCEVVKGLMAKNVFVNTQAFDFQGLCKTTPSKAKSGTRLLDPIKWILRAAAWMVYQTAIFLTEYALASFMPTSAEEAAKFVMSLTSNSTDFSSKIWNPYCKNSHYSLLDVKPGYFKSNSKIVEVGEVTCDTALLTNPCATNVTWMARRIDNTNLILVAVNNGGEECKACAKECEKIVRRFNIESAPANENRTIYIPFRRKPPWACGGNLTGIQENDKDCKAGISQAHAPGFLLKFVLPLTVLLLSVVR